MLTEPRRSLPAVRALSGSAEAIPLPDASVDAVSAGNAMHGFDMAVAGPEIARVLAPGGVLAGLWNVVDDRVEWVAGLARVSGSGAVGPRDTSTGWRARTADAHLPETGVAARFGWPEQAEFPHGQRRTADSRRGPRDARGDAGHAGTGARGHAGPYPCVPRERTGDRPRRVHPPDADRRSARPAAGTLHVDIRDRRTAVSMRGSGRGEHPAHRPPRRNQPGRPDAPRPG
ncbi:methyltransferase domain-containing protein [Streptomyces sp. NPDC088812]|uniref:methyltransferase domain-containing protein n=1 Tax=Streptomyces sp. NPDC088812 TaxID=3365905 RepID=UPI00382001BA